LLFRIVGPDRCLFGTERPGAGSKTDPRTGKWYDDVRPNIESIPWLTMAARVPRTVNPWAAQSRAHSKRCIAHINSRLKR
jgi:hypothetical protein